MPTTAYLFNHCSVALPATSSKPNFSGLRESAPCKALCLHCAFNADNNNIIFARPNCQTLTRTHTNLTNFFCLNLTLPLHTTTCTPALAPPTCITPSTVTSRRIAAHPPPPRYFLSDTFYPPPVQDRAGPTLRRFPLRTRPTHRSGALQ